VRVEVASNEDKIYELEIEKRNRRLNVITILPGFLGILLFMVLLSIDPFLVEKISGWPVRFIWLVDISLIIVSAMALIMRYLQTGFIIDKQKQLEELKINQEHYRERNIKEENNELKNTLESYKIKFSELHDKVENIDLSYSNSDKTELVNSVKEKVLKESSNELLNDVLNQAKQSFEKSNNALEIRKASQICIERIRSEITKLRWRGNLNLTIGVITTLLGLALLGYVVFIDAKQTTEMWPFLSHFLPRLSLVLFIEIFAFFFLRLYKASLDEVKYFQNEVTNIESKLLAMNLSLNSKDNIGLSNIIDELSKTERNFVLEKGQTTVELERSRLEKETVTSLSNNLVNAISNKP